MPESSLEHVLEVIRRERAALTDARGVARLAVPVSVNLMDDQLSPVLAYRRLVVTDARPDPSFLFESVQPSVSTGSSAGAQQQARHSILGGRPAMIVSATQHEVTITRPRDPDASSERFRADDPLTVPGSITRDIRLVRSGGLPAGVFLGGWVGHASYDSARYAEAKKLAFDGAPPSDRDIPDLCFAYYDGAVVFDHVTKLVHVVRLMEVAADAGDDEISRAHADALREAERTASELERHSKPLRSGRAPSGRGTPARVDLLRSNLTRDEHRAMVDRAKEHIAAGEAYQLVVGQRFERRSAADPFDVYRALRTVNPSPYMVYMQSPGVILVASSPEILCRVRNDPSTGERVLTNRPLAGTRKRGATPDEDAALEAELRADPKERAEHAMLVDLGRNDVGRLAEPGRVDLPALMRVERYSHVMHLSSTVVAPMREGLDAWDALRSTLPVGTVSGAPKVRAMQLIDELEPVRRGPYGGGMGYVGLDGDSDIALALRTIVTPVDARREGEWVYHLQASGGIVAESDPGAEFDETVNKASAMARAIDLAETAFTAAEARA